MTKSSCYSMRATPIHLTRFCFTAMFIYPMLLVGGLLLARRPFGYLHMLLYISDMRYESKIYIFDCFVGVNYCRSSWQTRSCALCLLLAAEIAPVLTKCPRLSVRPRPLFSFPGPDHDRLFDYYFCSLCAPAPALPCMAEHSTNLYSPFRNNPLRESGPDCRPMSTAYGDSSEFAIVG
jgi:hypothetical protein